MQPPSGRDGSSNWGAKGEGVSGDRLQQRPRPWAGGTQRGTGWVGLSNWWRQGGPEGAAGPPAQGGGGGAGAGSSLAGGRLVVCFLTETASRAGNQTQKEQDAQTDAEPCGGLLLSSLTVSAHPLACSCSQELPLGHLSEPATPNSQKSSDMPLGQDTQHPSILGAHFPACRRSPNLPCPPEGLTPLLPEGSPSS